LELLTWKDYSKEEDRGIKLQAFKLFKRITFPLLAKGLQKGFSKIKVKKVLVVG